MDVQELYNKLYMKKEYGRGDIVGRFSFDEVDLLLKGLEKMGADAKKGEMHLRDFKRESERDTIEAYHGLRAKVKTGIHKEKVGFIYVYKTDKKPLLVQFPSGERQVYHPEQIEIIEKDIEKFNQKFKELLFKS